MAYNLKSKKKSKNLSYYEGEKMLKLQIETAENEEEKEELYGLLSKWKKKHHK